MGRGLQGRVGRAGTSPVAAMSGAQRVTMWREGPAPGAASSSAQARCVALGNHTPTLPLWSSLFLDP